MLADTHFAFALSKLRSKLAILTKILCRRRRRRKKRTRARAIPESFTHIEAKAISSQRSPSLEKTRETKKASQRIEKITRPPDLFRP